MTTRVRLRLLDELALVTANGFGSPPPRWSGASFEARLHEYARFTAGQAEALLAEGDPGAIETSMTHLRCGATELGARARRQLGLRSRRDALEALTVFYREIGVDMSCVAPAGIVVHRCLFADYFSEPVCRVVGALDEGIAAGLSDGGRLRFDERLSSGATSCRAHLDAPGVR
jgi:hypothetical protein